ncbi:type VI secretion system protein VasD [Herbaspirillum sp. Sphag1AN]|uniref:type VI secretion system lipoprotein TssJ n=1 Tax=unclassified Herbaspirillum TaxID=2624150 RepID=UPI00161658F9|nr:MULTISPECIES: type VI secretion system lipoprotein TssJ [unclassified Herbaspirillum]MBB3213265.1 type VI secretion system protein VasD [Herbaspirillum sp. Sphag1AN]MBB3246462.1 type VI secretion system protein VasD [Herbaspirillum sp. Sphag64]
MNQQCQLAAAFFLVLALVGCGAAQATKDGSADAAKWAFTTKIKTMNIDLLARSSLNPNRNGQSLSTVIRIYQLKNADQFEKLDYTQLQHNDVDLLQPELLMTKGLVLRPDASVSISEPMNSDTEYIGIVAFFRDAAPTSQWKLVVPKKQWKKTDPVRIEVRENSLSLI